MSLIDIIIPSFDNWEYLGPCLNSICLHQSTRGLFKVYVINNGDERSIPQIIAPEVTVIHAGKNLGWEGGLKLGIQNSSSPFIVFLNDDTYIPYSSAMWLNNMIRRFVDPAVGAVGPSSNCVMGAQNIFIPCQTDYAFEVNMLIGFCMMVRRDALEKAGGVDDSLPHHGDDLDLSIRLREAGYKLICDKSVFVFHHGFKTGQREKGSEWNSVEMTERTNHFLIRKHGLKTFVKYVFNPTVPNGGINSYATGDSEGEVVRKHSIGDVLELGCGGQKTVENAVGVDIIPRGEYIPGLSGVMSVADHAADISEPLPFEQDKFDTVIARHLLEHLINPITVLRDWARVLKPGGRLVIAVPDQSKQNTIPMNYQHVHAYTPESLRTMMESIGFRTETIEDARNGISFVGVFNVNGVKHGHD